MKYAGIIANDIAAGPGICTTFFTQGCPHHCPECHNQQTWDFNGGREFSQATIERVIEALQANGIRRKLCVMGGEPLCQENLFITRLLITEVKKAIPDIEIYVWTGYYLKDLDSNNKSIQDILRNTNCLIDGPYLKDKRDITLFMRGSSNQNIIYSPFSKI